MGSSLFGGLRLSEMDPMPRRKGPGDYVRKNSLANSFQLSSERCALVSDTANPPSWATAPALPGILSINLLAASSIHRRASPPPSRLRKLVLASGECTEDAASRLMLKI